MSPFSRGRAVRIPFQANPFASAALESAWTGLGVDVGSINDDAFLRIRGEIRQLELGAKGAVLVTGPPGSGKTHLLGRLRNRLDLNRREGVADTVFLYVRCNASGATLWRHLRMTIAADLLKPVEGARSRADLLLAEPGNRLDRVEAMHLAAGRVLRALAAGRHRRVAGAWLRGEALRAEDLESLGVEGDLDDADVSREMEAAQAVHALLEFIAPTPTVLCFDQVEGLERYTGDNTGYHALGRAVSELHARHQHLFFLSCVVSEFEPRLEDAMLRADWDRFRQDQIQLRPIDLAMAHELVKARLDAAPGLASLRQAHPGEPLWPLSDADLEPLFATTGACLPRALLQHGKALFASLMGEAPSSAPRRTNEEVLREEYENNLRRARQSSAGRPGEKKVAEGLPWLLGGSGAKFNGPRPDIDSWAQLAFRGPRGHTAAVFCFEGGNAFTNRLKKVNQAWDSNAARLILVCDPSIRPGAKGAQLLAGLEQRGAVRVTPLPEAVAALQAIRDMVTAARAGELANDGDPIGEEEVTRWALDNLPPQLEQFRDQLFETSPADPLLAGLSELVYRERVISAEQAALRISHSLEEVARCALSHPMQFGVLEGPPLVLFQPVEGSPPEAADA
ncbi:MAG: ATP-binding protein [Bryobacteraceae bacterium]